MHPLFNIPQFSWDERLPCKQEATGSIPAGFIPPPGKCPLRTLAEL